MATTRSVIETAIVTALLTGSLAAVGEERDPNAAVGIRQSDPLTAEQVKDQIAAELRVGSYK